MQDPRLAAALNALNASIRDLKKSVDDMAEEQSPAAQRERSQQADKTDALDRRKALKDQIKIEEDLEKKMKLRIERLKNEIEVTQHSNKTDEQKAKRIKRLKDLIEELTKAQEENTEAQKSAEGAGEALADTLGNMLGVSGKLNNSLMSQAKTVLTTEQVSQPFRNRLTCTLPAL